MTSEVMCVRDKIVVVVNFTASQQSLPSMKLVFLHDTTCSGKANGAVVCGEMREQFDDAALTTSRAFAQVRQQRLNDDADVSVSQSLPLDEGSTDKDKDNKLSAEVQCMQPILRFLQLLCENHNRDLQVCH